MASSAKSIRPESASTQLLARFEAAATTILPPNGAVCVGLSGGLDSVVLLDLFCRVRERFGWQVQALHVHHGLSPNADGWAAFCRRLASRRGIALRVVRVDLEGLGHMGLEAAAREMRYREYVRCGAAHVALAHHADDQAETVLLQLLRGSGVAGLAAMPMVRRLGDASNPQQMLVRPLLDCRREMIAAYARARRLGWVEDESNQDGARTRNALRHDILPRLAAIQPGVVENLNRSARHLGAALEVLGEAAGRDLAAVASTKDVQVARVAKVASDPAALRLRCAALRDLGEVRAMLVLKAWLQRQGLRAPSSARLRETWLQVSGARPDAQVRIDLEGAVLRRYRGELFLDRYKGPCGPGALCATSLPWDGAADWHLADLGGTLRLVPATGVGLAAHWLQPAARLSLVARPAGPLRLVGAAHHRSLKRLFQDAGVPAWVRVRLPFLAIDGVLAWVAGLGVAAQFAPAAGEAALLPHWLPDLPPAPG